MPPELESLLAKLLRAPRQAAMSSFRWMHYGLLLRPPLGSRAWENGREDSAHGLFQQIAEWQAQQGDDPFPAIALPALVKVARVHAWSMGCPECAGLIDMVWPQLSPVARGRVAAAFTVSAPEPWEWLEPRWNPACGPLLLDAASATQLACVAIERDLPALLARVLEGSAAWRERHLRRIHYDGKPLNQTEWQPKLVGTSNRAIDLCLEYAIRLEKADPAAACLSQGAEPDLAIWHLDRSYNEKFCALSHAVRSPNFSRCNRKLVKLLLDAGASPAGSSYDGFNKPLFLALDNADWDLADELLDRGASFTSKAPEAVPAVAQTPDEIRAARGPHPLMFRSAKEIEWGEHNIGTLVPFVAHSSKAWFYQGGGQFGRCCSFLHPFLHRDDLDRMKHFAKRGLPLDLSLGDLLHGIYLDAYRCLEHLLGIHGDAKTALFRILQRVPDFATACQQHLCGPEDDGSNVIGDFDSHGQAACYMPDGSRYHADLDAIAGPSHGLGPIAPGHIFVRKVHARYRRESVERVATLGLKVSWKAIPIPSSTRNLTILSVQVAKLLPLVKELDGKFIWTGTVLERLWWLHMPPAFKANAEEWNASPAHTAILEEASRRIAAQAEANALLPAFGKQEGARLESEGGISAESPAWALVEETVRELDEGYGNSFCCLSVPANSFVQALRGFNGYHLEMRISTPGISYLHCRACYPGDWSSEAEAKLEKADFVNSGQARDLLSLDDVLAAFRSFYSGGRPPEQLRWRVLEI